ncbi:MAG: hypothetical protein GKR91_12725 [Pseudomonadales bacterium]|nr:hypothetical protein [Pseudomonadales bacterium]
MQDKREHYEILLDKMALAHEQEFHLEASWIAYSILEDRLLSALKRSGGTTYPNGDDIRMLGQKIQELIARRAELNDQHATGDKLLGAYFSLNLLDKLKDWKDRRNDLMHAMADSTKTIAELSKETYLLSLDSKQIVKDTCNAARLLKKNRSKA